MIPRRCFSVVATSLMLASTAASEGLDSGHLLADWPKFNEWTAEIRPQAEAIASRFTSDWSVREAAEMAALGYYTAQVGETNALWSAKPSTANNALDMAGALAAGQWQYATQFGLPLDQDYLGVTSLVQHASDSERPTDIANGTGLLALDIIEIAAQSGIATLDVTISTPQDWARHNTTDYLQAYSTNIEVQNAHGMFLNRADLVALPVQINGLPVLSAGKDDSAGDISHRSAYEQAISLVSARYINDPAAIPIYFLPQSAGRDFAKNRIPEDFTKAVGTPRFYGPSIGTPQFSGVAQLALSASRNNMQGDAGPNDDRTDPIRRELISYEIPCDSNHPNAPPCYNSAVSLHRNGVVHCSGALVGSRWVLSAAHCACNAPHLTASVGYITPTWRGDVPNLTESIGLTGKACFFGQSGQTCEDRHADISSHDFCVSNEIVKNINTDTPQGIQAHQNHYKKRDLVLFELQAPLRQIISDPITDMVFATPKHIVTLGHPDRLGQLSVVAVAGFGSNDWQARGGDKTVAPFSMQSPICPANTRCVVGVEFVTKDPNNAIDSCNGDSGAGIYAAVPEGGLQLFGIVSRALDTGCGPGGINTIVADVGVIGWIISNVPDADLSPGPDPALAQLLRSQN